MEFSVLSRKYSLFDDCVRILLLSVRGFARIIQFTDYALAEALCQFLVSGNSENTFKLPDRIFSKRKYRAALSPYIKFRDGVMVLRSAFIRLHSVRTMGQRLLPTAPTSAMPWIRVRDQKFLA